MRNELVFEWGNNNNSNKNKKNFIFLVSFGKRKTLLSYLWFIVPVAQQQ